MEAEYPGGSACCFCISTKKKFATKGNNEGVLSSGHNIEWGKNNEMLSDVSTFSVKEQERRLKKALEEEARVSREAEKVVQWVKQESAKIDSSTIKIILSDDQEKEVPAN